MKRKKSKKKTVQSQKNAVKQSKDTKKPRGLVSVIIPTLNQTSLARDCVHAVQKNTQHITYELILVDDGSAKDVQEYLRAMSEELDVKLILKSKTEGFGKACNTGIEDAKGVHIVIMHTDVKVDKGWLTGLVKVAEKENKAGIVGARLLFPDGSIQHAGISFNQDAGFEYRYKSYKRDHYGVIQQCDVDAVTFALALINRDLIDEIGMLDGSLFVSLEDIDFCLRARQAGFRVIYCPSCLATHTEGGTVGRSIPEKDLYWLKAEIDGLDRFAAKWSDTDIGRAIPSFAKLPSVCQSLFQIEYDLPHLIELVGPANGQ
jgi:GT2 family glycosyltransferase